MALPKQEILIFFNFPPPQEVPNPICFHFPPVKQENFPHFSGLCKGKLCSVWEARCSHARTDGKKKCKVFQKPEPRAAEWLLNCSLKTGLSQVPEAQLVMHRSPLRLPPHLQFIFHHLRKSHLKTKHQLNNQWTTHLPLQIFPKVLLFPK